VVNDPVKDIEGLEECENCEFETVSFHDTQLFLFS